MNLTLLAKDRRSEGSGCPSVYVAEDGFLVIQGDGLDPWTQGNLLNVLPGEVAVRISPDVVREALSRLA